jgi:hypothetical protein
MPDKYGSLLPIRLKNRLLYDKLTWQEAIRRDSNASSTRKEIRERFKLKAGKELLLFAEKASREDFFDIVSPEYLVRLLQAALGDPDNQELRKKLGVQHEIVRQMESNSPDGGKSPSLENVRREVADEVTRRLDQLVHKRKATNSIATDERRDKIRKEVEAAILPRYAKRIEELEIAQDEERRLEGLVRNYKPDPRLVQLAKEIAMIGLQYCDGQISSLINPNFIEYVSKPIREAERTIRLIAAEAGKK